eukprot:358019-Chlamydomonas_euryale.AAC.2
MQRYEQLADGSVAVFVEGKEQPVTARLLVASVRSGGELKPCPRPSHLHTSPPRYPHRDASSHRCEQESRAQPKVRPPLILASMPCRIDASGEERTLSQAATPPHHHNSTPPHLHMSSRRYEQAAEPCSSRFAGNPSHGTCELAASRSPHALYPAHQPPHCSPSTPAPRPCRMGTSRRCAGSSWTMGRQTSR